MTDTRVPLRTSNILEIIAASRAARIAELQDHAYRIDPGVKLAMDICDRERIGDDHTITVL